MLVGHRVNKLRIPDRDVWVAPPETAGVSGALAAQPAHLECISRCRVHDALADFDHCVSVGPTEEINGVPGCPAPQHLRPTRT